MRMNLKKEKNKRNKLLLILGIITIIFIFSLVILNQALKTVSIFFAEYSTSEVEKISLVIINNSVTDEALTNLLELELYKITKNNKEEIEMIDYNPIVVNLFLREITNNIQRELIYFVNSSKNLSINSNDQNINFYIPLGRIFSSPFLNQMGPKIPVQVEFIGNVQSYIKTNIKEYGINNSLIEISVVVEINAKIMLPLIVKDINLKKEIPISYKIIKGSIPNYYSSENGKSSGIYSVPLV